MIIRAAPCTLLLPVLGWVAGLIAGQYFHIPVSGLIILICLNIIILYLLKYNSRLLLLLIFLLAVLRLQIAETKPSNHLDKIMAPYSQVETSLTGTISRLVSTNYSSYLYLLKVKTIDNSPVHGSIYLQTDSRFMPGDWIKGDVKIEKIEGPRNPGQPDKRNSYKYRRISGRGTVNGEMQLLTEHKPGIFPKLANAIERRLQKRLGTAAEYALAVTLGKTGETDWQFRKSVRRAGLSHLFAVSGLHIGMAALLFIGLLTLIFPRRPARIILIFLLIIYGFLCQWTPSVSRAILMLAFYIICQLLERPVNLNQILLFSLLVITLTDPFQIFSAGLQLSFAATLVLVNLSPILEQKLFRNHLNRFKTLIRRLGQTLLLTISVILFIAPLSLANFGEFSGNAIFTLIPASIIFALLLPLSFILIILPWGWQPFAQSFKFFLFLFDKWLELTASLPLYLQNINLKFWQVFCLYLLLLLIILFLKRRSKVQAVLCLLLIPAVFILPKFHTENSSSLKISCLDCGQGDLCLMELPSGEKLLIDTGPPVDQGGNASLSLLPWLAERAIGELDQVIITHAHDDHYGGLLAIFDALNVKSVVTGKDFWQDIDDIEIYSAFQNEKSRYITIRDTMSIYYGETRLQFLHPDSLFGTTKQNNKSLVVKLTYHDFTALFTGDIETEAEDWLLCHYRQYLDCDFLKVPHHGSISSSGSEFIDAVSPVLCFIPAGKGNRFQFPHQTVVNRYKFLGDKLLIAANDGAMLLQTDGFQIRCQIMLRDSTIHLNCQ
ncbi:MAG: DNA internalization-related competence protein ComEC/Rec2 [Candidatus Cloacimonetes bacterium]|nr:DNA internalization-related competence protein ComEC/Rec2 [Candidatus Cloacimonadota bacterium]